ncbi:hypothetical protein M440DRAFT_159443 [Trichoderma longibrachiatum ATCC 18648]|uniref:Uncharacterized protein n=1 Tax=Trichoderma longibrachiatum ATCC 18648 TaxID=983965 RepID=A0A2T4BT83_TRILO|nr:hypothetical protein M440DRAFT_159443 [Trichoderma longibrachiatum ATCC 18648]
MKIKLFCTETHPPPLPLSPRRSSHQTNLDKVFTKLTPVNAAKCPLPWTMAPRGQRSPALPPSSPTRETTWLCSARLLVVFLCSHLSFVRQILLVPSQDHLHQIQSV